MLQTGNVLKAIIWRTAEMFPWSWCTMHCFFLSWPCVYDARQLISPFHLSTIGMMVSWCLLFDFEYRYSLSFLKHFLDRVIRSCWRAGFMLVSSALIACSIICQGRTWFFQAHGQCDPWQHFHVSTLHYAYLIKRIMNSRSVNFYSPPASASRIKVSALEACLFPVSFRAALCLWVSWSPCSKSRVLHCMHYCLCLQSYLIQLKMLKFVNIECVMIFAFALAERKRILQ